MDKGPWFVFHGRKPEQKLLGVQSEDFTHDVWLEVHGDFGPPEDKLAYCEWLAFTLNKKPAAWRLLWEARESRITQLESDNSTIVEDAAMVADENKRLKQIAEAAVRYLTHQDYDGLLKALRAEGYLSE